GRRPPGRTGRYTDPAMASHTRCGGNLMTMSQYLRTKKSNILESGGKIGFCRGRPTGLPPLRLSLLAGMTSIATIGMAYPGATRRSTWFAQARRGCHVRVSNQAYAGARRCGTRE